MNTTPALPTAILDFALAQVGKGYDYRGIFGFIARKDIARAGRWFCSELVSAAFAQAGASLLRMEPNKVSPGDLATSRLLMLSGMIVTPAKPAPRDTPAVPYPLPGSGLRVALYLGRSWLSRSIEWITWSDYSHSALILPDNTVIEAWGRHGVVHHADIAEFHDPATCIHIYQPVWEAIEAVRLADSEMMGTRQTLQDGSEAPGGIQVPDRPLRSFCKRFAAFCKSIPQGHVHVHGRDFGPESKNNPQAGLIPAYSRVSP